MNKILVFIINLICLSGYLAAQEPDSTFYEGNYSVAFDSIIIRGNDVTNDHIILRELTFAIGENVTQDDLNFNRERIYSLGLFTLVNLHPYRKNDLNFLLIDVKESWYIYPIPFAQLEDKDWKKISYGAFLIFRNFRGMNESIFARVSLGYDPSFLLSYFNPYLDRDEDIFFGVDLLYRTIANKSKIAQSIYGSSFDQKFITGQVTLGKRFGLYHRIRTDLSYRYIETPFYIRGISASDNRIDRVPAVALSYSYDTRDLVQFPKEGMFGFTQFQLNGFGLNDVNYFIFRVDFREYRKILGDLLAKWRFTTRIAAGKLVPYYDFSFIGFNERIRGYYNRLIEGHKSFLSSLEVFQPIIKDMNINLDFVPLIPDELLSYRIALYAQLFADTGTSQINGKPVSIRDLNTGFGIGLTFLVLPYNLLRIEYAFDEFFNPEIIIDVGISF